MVDGAVLSNGCPFDGNRVAFQDCDSEPDPVIAS